ATAPGMPPAPTASSRSAPIRSAGSGAIDALAGQQGGAYGGGGERADGAGQFGEAVPDVRGAEYPPGPGDRQRPEAAPDGFGQGGEMLGGAQRDLPRFGVLGGERGDDRGQCGEPGAFGRVGADLADQGLQTLAGGLDHGPVDQRGAATHAVFPAQRPTDGGAADPVGAALVAEQESVTARTRRALPVPAGRHGAGAGDNDHARGAEEGAGPGAVRIAGDVHRAACLPGQGLAEVAGMAGLAQPRHADARGGRVRGLNDLAELHRETLGEQRVHRRAFRADRNRAALEQDDAGAAAADVDAEDPPGQAGQGAVPGGAWLAHGLTLDAAGICERAVDVADPARKLTS